MGITMSTPSNKTMVDELVDKHQYIKSAIVEGAFRAVDRAMYFNLEQGDTFDPYSEVPWRDGNIHLSAPCIYAKAVEALALEPGHSFLNLGSGTGYLNTIVGLIIGPHGINHGIEYHLDVVEYARERLERFKRESFAIDKYDFAEPTFIHGDCVKLNPNVATYDRVYLGAACSPELESFMKKLVKPAGGVLVMPLDCYLLRYIRITEVDWRVEKLMQVSFTLMIREPRGSEEENEMIDMPLAQPKSLIELCRIHIRQHVRDKTDQENPNLLNSDNIAARKVRKAQAELKMNLKRDRELRRKYNACPYNRDGNDPDSQSAEDHQHRTCRRWPCREFNDFMAKASASNEDRMMTRSARRRFELSRAFNYIRGNQPSNNRVRGALPSGQPLRRGDDNGASGSESSSSSGDNNRGGTGLVVTRGEGCSRTRPFVSKSNRAQHGIRERAPSPTRLGEPYRVTRSAFPASRRSDVHRINDSSYRPNFISSPSTASSQSDSSSSSSVSQNDEEYHYRHPMLPDFQSLLRIRRLASRALISSIFEPIPDALDDEDSDYELDSDDGDSFDDDFNDPDLSGLESFEEYITDEESDEEEDDDDESGVNEEDGESSEESDEDDENGGDREGEDDNARPSDRLRRCLPRSVLQHASDIAANISRAIVPTVSTRLVRLRSSSTPTVVVAPSSRSSAPSQLSCDHRTRYGGNQSTGTDSSSMVMETNKYHHCHKQHQQQGPDRKRKRQSSSSSCSEASNTPSPSKRGISEQSTPCCNHREARGRGNSIVRRRCGCPRGPVATMMQLRPDICDASSLESRGNGDQLVVDASKATSNSSTTEADDLVESTGHRWTRLRSLISARAKNYARQTTTSSLAQTSSSGTTQSGSVCLPHSGSGSGGSSGETFTMAEETPTSTHYESDRSVPNTTTTQQDCAAATRCHHHHSHSHHHHNHRHRHHHCHGHAHHRHHHHRYCCGKCSRHRSTASSGNQQSGSAEIESLSSPSSSPAATPGAKVAAAAAAAAAAVPPAPASSSASSSFSSTCQGTRESGELKNSHESKDGQQPEKQQRRQRRSKKKNQRRVRSENECQRYHNHMGTLISQLPVPQVLRDYLNFDRENI